MKRKVLLLSFLAIGLSFTGINVNAQKTCGSDVYLQQQLRANPAFRSKLAAFEKIWQEKQSLLNNTANRVVVTGTDTVYEIPVVFQVINTGLAIGAHYNPSLAKVQGVVDYLNQVYGATYPSYPGVGSGGVNIPLRFVLAKRDPNCNVTDGINRINANTVLSGTMLTSYLNYGVSVITANGVPDATIKGLIQWDPSLYYNIWVVNKIDGWDGYSAGGGVVGYAQFAGGPSATDGTVIMERFNDADEPTLPHELGHAFNLFHVFQGGCLNPLSNPCATTGDYVCDTDPQDQSFNCETGNTLCGAPWSPTIKNIMSYAQCTDRFTAGQRARIKTALLTQRGSLILSLGGVAPGAQTTYPLPVVLSACSNPGILNSGNINDIGPTSIHIADLHYYSNGYTGDGDQVYINRTVASCGLEAAAPATMVVGQSYPVEIGTGYNPENVRIWIDYDNNGTFSPAELAFSSNALGGLEHYRVHAGTITIPSTADTNAILRMRVISDFWSNTSPSPCGGTLGYGQTEDYSVRIYKTPPVATPVTFKNIQAKPAVDNKSIDVIWKVATENNVINYDVEHSLDGKSFSKIGSVLAKGSISSYQFNDAFPALNQKNFYRLKMIGLNYKTNYSTIVTASIKSNTEIEAKQLKIYPNPAENLINIVTAQSGTFDVNIKNELGQLVYSKKGINMKVGISTTINFLSNSMASGIYYLQLIDKTGISLNGKFVKK